MLASAHGLLLLALCGPWGAPSGTGEEPVPTAPDGRRGLSAEPTPRALEKLFRSREREDVRFLAGLADLGSDVRILVATLAEAYRGAGYFELLTGEREPEIEDLHDAFRAHFAQPLAALEPSSSVRAVFVRMALDVRFRVRLGILAGWRTELAELRGGVAVLSATSSGYVTLTSSEALNIATRVDLAASRLRALRNDLNALRTEAGPGSEVSGEEAGELVALAASSPADQWPDRWERAQRLVDRRVAAMRSILVSDRLEPKLRAALERRAEALRRAEDARRETLVLLPDTPEGEDAPADVKRLAKHRRIQLALYRSREGLELDPLNEELAYVAARSADFLLGALESGPLYDRFLALRGIRVHDHRTLRGRELTAREQEAILAVQRAPAGNGLTPR